MATLVEVVRSDYPVVKVRLDLGEDAHEFFRILLRAVRIPTLMPDSDVAKAVREIHVSGRGVGIEIVK